MTRAAGVVLTLVGLLLGFARPGAAACEACVTAGAGRAVLALPPGTPLGGYGSLDRRLLFPDVFGRYPHAFWLKPSRGQREPLAARALTLERDGTRVTWVTLDLVAVDQELTRLLTARLGPDVGTLIVSASHTHSGPGAFVHSLLAEVLTMDRFDGLVREAILAAAVGAVRMAEASRAPARVGVARIDGPGVVRSRLGKPLDHDVIVLALRRVDGAPVAVVWNFAIHNTMLGPSNIELAGDVTGSASLAIEKQLAVPALFVNGALGDVSPARHGAAALPGVAAELVRAVLDGWGAAVPLADATLRAQTITLALPAPRLSLRNCLGRWVPRSLALPLGGAFPRQSALTGVALGTAAWVAVPGELQTALGRRVKLAARELFGEGFVAGVSNDYLGYLLTAADYAEPTYVSCASLYGADAGERITEQAVAMLTELRGRSPAAGGHGR
ncbi:MAG TPA: neutral/alkaline non-lysosomal ceramidase N-terminal domain-containing protein [Methylomirabilota bacterium]|nr:neutral/alkaline non-lysosomal ceramidase N-terminal domain-containing protein [Methylomirabilota bacterium]